MAKIREDIEQQLINRIVDGEFATASSNRSDDNDEFDSYLDLLDSVRESKDYDWMSDIRIPEFISHVLTQASIDANQYFSTKDFVEVYLEDDSNDAKAYSEAAKECINRTLNQKHLYHYLKYMRSKSLNNLTGRVYARCWWEQKTRRELVGTKESFTPTGLDVDGFPISSTDQIPGFEKTTEDVFEDVPVLDRFNYDVMDSRNVFTDNKYTYSIQEKDWVIIRSEKTEEDLRKDAVDNGYFNLDAVGKIKPNIETDTSKGTYNSGRSTTAKTKEENPINKYYDVLERFGKYWCKVLERDEEGNAVDVVPGIDEYGKPLDGAELLETIITFATSGSSKTLIRFQVTPYVDFKGVPFKPLIRGICYIHPTNDAGMGDGKHVKELQLALDDTFNISNDRVMLATLPVLKVKRYEAEDNPEIYIEPGHKIPLENPKDDLEELQISDDITGALGMMDMLIGKMQQVDAIQPPSMGQTGLASTTATAIAGADQGTDMRSNYKALTFENTFLTELYWMILNMTWAFAHPDTGETLMGDKVVDFHPDKEYFYKPLSQSIEPEHSKVNKIKLWTQILGYTTSIPHPDAVKQVNFILTNIYKLMGDEFANYANNMLDEEIPIEEPQNVQTEGASTPASNDAGVPVSGLEQTTREF